MVKSPIKQLKGSDLRPIGEKRQFVLDRLNKMTNPFPDLDADLINDLDHLVRRAERRVNQPPARSKVSSTRDISVMVTFVIISLKEILTFLLNAG